MASSVGVSQILPNPLPIFLTPSSIRNGNPNLPLNKKAQQDTQIRKPLLVKNRTQKLHLRYVLYAIGELYRPGIEGVPGTVGVWTLPTLAQLCLSSISH